MHERLIYQGESSGFARCFVRDFFHLKKTQKNPYESREVLRILKIPKTKQKKNVFESVRVTHAKTECTRGLFIKGSLVVLQGVL